MELWPAIDLRGGRCVRLLQGDYERETVFAEDPVAQARAFVTAGARRLHVVDLDGARVGAPVQVDLVGKIVAAVGVPVQLGGGTRSRAAVAAWLDVGVSRVVIGSLAIQEPETFAALAREFPNRIVLGLDARDGRVAVHGWQETSAVTAVDVARRHAGLPLAAVVFTDIATDGMLTGPNLEALTDMIRATPQPVIASGGIASAADIRAVAAAGAAGCIVGRALYSGEVTLPEAVAAAESPGSGPPAAAGPDA
jgi:phosphoribosylformimino-5-aminoimidazole carboxamide ribotide isomerase